MKWRPEWEDLDAETFSRISKLNSFDSLTVAWLQRPEERPWLRDQMGDAMYNVHQDDRRLCERIFERTAVGAENAVEDAYFALAERVSEIARPNDPPVETDESPSVAKAEESKNPPTVAEDEESKNQLNVAEALLDAAKMGAVDRANAVMNSMLDEDDRRHDWTLIEWATRLGHAKKTIINTHAWKVRIKNWRTANAPAKVSKETGEDFLNG